MWTIEKLQARVANANAEMSAGTMSQLQRDTIIRGAQLVASQQFGIKLW